MRRVKWCVGTACRCLSFLRCLRLDHWEAYGDRFDMCSTNSRGSARGWLASENYGLILGQCASLAASLRTHQSHVPERSGQNHSAEARAKSGGWTNHHTPLRSFAYWQQIQ